MREDDLRKLPEFPARALIWDRLAKALEDPHLTTLILIARDSIVWEDERCVEYDDTAIVDLCDHILAFPAGLTASEFVPEKIRDGVRRAVELASRIRGRMFYGGMVVDFDTFFQEISRLLDTLSEVFQEL